MAEMTTGRQALGLGVWLVATFAAAAVGGLASADAGAFYAQLNRPAWAPPAWLFGPVWSALYLAMGIAAWLVWRVRGFRGVSSPALTLYLIQLVANALWTWLFFVWRHGTLACVDILVLWALILTTLILFWRIRPVAGALLIPYLAWVTFASALTLVLLRLNPELFG